ncbi:MAG: hypothetical protein ACRDPI_06390 [Nocardioidaceae bacterium]
MTPATSLLFGLAFLFVGWLGDNLEFGIFGLVLMVVFGGLFVVAGRRSETVAGLMDRRDERINDLDLRATTFAGMAALLAVILMFLIEIARGRDGSPYYQLGALYGVAYLVGLVYQRLRR